MLAPGYFARQDTKTPVRTAMQAFGLTMAINLAALGVLQWSGRIGVLGLHIILALSTATGALLNSWLLYRGLRKQAVYRPAAGWRALLIRILLANLVMAVFLYFCSGGTAEWLALSTARRIGWMAGLVSGGAASYFACLWLFGLRPVHLKH